MADFKREGTIDINQWRLFHDVFAKKFQELDADGDAMISKSEVIK